MVLIFFTNTHRFHPVKYSVGLFTQKMQMELQHFQYWEHNGMQPPKLRPLAVSPLAGELWHFIYFQQYDRPPF